MFVYRRMLHGGGTYVAVGGGLPQISLPTTNWKKKGALLYRQLKPREFSFSERSR
jgi:hypothetical protein